MQCLSSKCVIAEVNEVHIKHNVDLRTTIAAYTEELVDNGLIRVSQ